MSGTRARADHDLCLRKGANIFIQGLLLNLRFNVMNCMLRRCGGYCPIEAAGLARTNTSIGSMATRPRLLNPFKPNFPNPGPETSKHSETIYNMSPKPEAPAQKSNAKNQTTNPHEPRGLNNKTGTPYTLSLNQTQRTSKPTPLSPPNTGSADGFEVCSFFGTSDITFNYQCLHLRLHPKLRGGGGLPSLDEEPPLAAQQQHPCHERLMSFPTSWWLPRKSGLQAGSAHIKLASDVCVYVHIPLDIFVYTYMCKHVHVHEYMSLCPKPPVRRGPPPLLQTCVCAVGLCVLQSSNWCVAEGLSQDPLLCYGPERARGL